MKIYRYPQGNLHVHDDIESYHGVVPFSRYHTINETQNPEEADVFYMGQFGDSHQVHTNFEHLEKYRNKHWADIEGDWLNRTIPHELDGINITINGLVKGIEKRFNKVFVRPTFSTFLVNATKRENNFNLPKYKSFGFKGYPDPFGLRYRLSNIIKTLPNEFILTNQWNGPASVGGQEHTEYEKLMLKHIFHLCPRGAGHDSVRFFESCFFGRVPIIIGDNWLFGELNGLDVSFAFRISQYVPDFTIKNELTKIYNIDWIEIKDKCNKAKLYFEEVKKYFINPTQYLFNQIGI